MARVSIEDCKRKIPNRFALTMVASHRTRQLISSAQPKVKTSNSKAVTALREIADGKVGLGGALQFEVSDAAPAAVDPLNFLE